MPEKSPNEEIKELLHELEVTQPIDKQGNPFAILPEKDLREIKQHIEELSEELAPKIND